MGRNVVKAFRLPRAAVTAPQIFDPPDSDLAALAAIVNKKARSGRVSFFAKQGDVSAIFQHGARRAVIALGGRPSESDIDDMATALESWSGFQSDVSPYSPEVPSLPESGW